MGGHRVSVQCHRPRQQLLTLIKMVTKAPDICLLQEIDTMIMMMGTKTTTLYMSHVRPHMECGKLEMNFDMLHQILTPHLIS